MSDICICKLWYSENENEWKKALEEYNKRIKSENKNVENDLSNISISDIKNYSGEEFYNLIHDCYIKWKYTDCRWFKGIKGCIENYNNKCGYIFFKNIHSDLLSIDKSEIESHLRNIMRIKGIGVAGASGLLALLMPEYFGTVDQFVVKELKKLNLGNEYEKINENDIKINDAVLMITLMKEKAKELNEKFVTDIWTARKIDMVLWGIAPRKNDDNLHL